MLCMVSCHMTAHVLELVFLAAMQVLLTYLPARTVALANDICLCHWLALNSCLRGLAMQICTIEADQGLGNCLGTWQHAVQLHAQS